MLEIKNAVFGYRKKHGNKVIIDNISFGLQRGELLCILGANGAGKTTMYRTVLGFIELLGGQVIIDGQDISELSRVQLARKIAYVPQYHTPPFPYSVSDVVLMGRNAHLPQFASPGKEDLKIAEQMMERMGITCLKGEVYTEVSGGERQMVLIARALAQQSDYILMDEPTANLDFGNQVRVLRILRDLAKEGIGICFTSHNPSHALNVGSSVLAIKDSTHVYKGSAEQVITAEVLKDMYDVDAKIVCADDGTEDGILDVIVSI